jgi:hypothetical protein
MALTLLKHVKMCFNDHCMLWKIPIHSIFIFANCHEAILRRF